MFVKIALIGYKYVWKGAKKNGHTWERQSAMSIKLKSNGGDSLAAKAAWNGHWERQIHWDRGGICKSIDTKC